MVYVDHLEKLIGYGLFENQYISNPDQSVDIEPVMSWI